MNHYKKYWPLKILFFLIAAAAFISLLGWVVMSLWNRLLPEIIGVRMINFWQALGLLLLIRILFGKWGGFGRHHSGPKRAMWRKKWHSMTAEEKSAFKARWKEKCRSHKPEE